MTDNPYSPPPSVEPTPSTGWKFTTRLLKVATQYVAAYSIGIVACILITPVETELAGVQLWPLYPPLAVVGFVLFYVSLKASQLELGNGAEYWMVFSFGLLPIVIEAIVLGRIRKLYPWRPVWIGVPIGFVGTLGVYYTAAASI